MLNGYIHAAIDYQWLGLNRLAGILSRRVSVAYAAQIISCPKQSAYGGYFLMSNNIPHWNKAEDHG
ncbi:hypothetical protein R6242_09170 [Iodobacter sp. CM08]|uniref:hypothetical protein n=1 Tax=Iodobacter sp. CM08 TaxID=3085902 RepID=UPI00298210F2|nr:hypothetical protein [Iodobacter sp. CM08]MDW5416740.1 hypothetical protein [Iodobacter sp. CM08]